MQILDGQLISAQIKEEIKETVDRIKAQGKRAPKLVAVLVGNDGASQTYVASKAKACDYVGFDSEVLRFDENMKEEDLLSTVKKLNDDPGVDGMIVQLPLPSHIDSRLVTEAILPEKDVDGFHPFNVGKMFKGLPCFLPATPYGIIELLKRYNVPTEGKHCVVIGRSDIVGKPVSALLSRNEYPGNCTVTLCHSKTKDLAAFTKNADIIIAALGKPAFLKADMVKDGAVIIDVGITRVDDPSNPKGYSIKGDVDFENVAPKSSFITPVPKGVGPMTIVSLMKNTLESYLLKNPL